MFWSLLTFFGPLSKRIKTLKEQRGQNSPSPFRSTKKKSSDGELGGQKAAGWAEDFFGPGCLVALFPLFSLLAKSLVHGGVSLRNRPSWPNSQVTCFFKMFFLFNLP